MKQIHFNVGRDFDDDDECIRSDLWLARVCRVFFFFLLAVDVVVLNLFLIVFFFNVF